MAQPVFDLLSKNAGLFVTLGTTWLETVALALVTVVMPPLVLWVVEVLVGLLVPKLRAAAHALLAAGVIAVIGVEAFKRLTDLPPRVLLGLGAVVAVAGGLLMLRSALFRSWLRFLAIAPVLFAVLFLFTSSVTSVVLENDVASAEGVSVDHPKRIVVLVFDELPLQSLLDGSGHVDETLFPNLAALERNSTWFRNATTVAPYTDVAVPALLTGLYPGANYEPPVAAAYPDNLFTLLDGIYRMNVFETVTRLCPTGLCAGGDGSRDSAGFGALLDTTYSLWSDFATPRREPAAVNPARTHTDANPLRTADAFVRSLRSTSKPELDFLHVLLPHQPWHLRRGGQDDLAGGAIPSMVLREFWANPFSAASARQRHLLQVQVADDVVGEVVDRLERIGEYEDSVLVVTADHGVAFTVGQPYRGVTAINYPELLWIPLLVHAPGQRSAVVDDRPAESIDVLPTIADLVDADIPWEIDGASLFRDRDGLSTVRVSPWVLNRVKPPRGQDHVTFPRAPGFATQIRASASKAAGPGDLRLYQVGEFGALVGRDVASLAHEPATDLIATMTGPTRLRDVHPDAHAIPWAWVEGTIEAIPTGVPLAVTVNGVVAGLAETWAPGKGAPAQFWSTLAPTLFRPGRNELRIYRVDGDATAPRLVPVPVSA